MIPDSRNTPNRDPQSQRPPTDVSTQSPAGRKTALPDAMSMAIHDALAMTPLSGAPPRPSTAPPHPASDATKGKEPQTDVLTRTTLVSNLRARNLLLQKAISHIDDAVLHLVAARSGIPSSKMQQVRGEARNRKDLLDRVDRAIKMAQNGELREESHGGDISEGTSSGAGHQRLPTESRHILLAEAPSGTVPSTPSSFIRLSPTDNLLDVPQLRRSSSQPQLGPSAGDRQVPVKVHTLPELIERRNVLRESIESWQNFVVELGAAQPRFGAQSDLPDVVATEETSSWAAKYQRAQFEIRRREDLLLRLNQVITQASQSAYPLPTPEQFTMLATYMPPALDKARFDVAYAHFCRERSIPVNTAIVMPDVGKPVIDVYALHTAVMEEGSFTRVSTRKSWDVVGGRLGFIQTAATATEPARCTPEIATHLEKAYRDCLQQFDHLYVSSVIDTVRKRMADQHKRP